MSKRRRLNFSHRCLKRLKWTFLTSCSRSFITNMFWWSRCSQFDVFCLYFSWLLSLFLWFCLFYQINSCDASLCLSRLSTVNLYIVFLSCLTVTWTRLCSVGVSEVHLPVQLTWTCLTLKLLELTQELATASTVLSSRLWSCSSSGDLSSSRMSSMTSGPTWSLLPRSFCITCSSTYSMPTTSSSMAAGSSVRPPAGLPVRLTWFIRRGVYEAADGAEWAGESTVMSCGGGLQWTQHFILLQRHLWRKQAKFQSSTLTRAASGHFTDVCVIRAELNMLMLP